MLSGVLNDAEKAVRVVMDQALSGETIAGARQNDTAASVWLKYGDMKRLMTMMNETRLI